MNPINRIVNSDFRQSKTGHSWDFFNVLFLVDFGPWKKGDRFTNLIFDVSGGQITCYNLVKVEEGGRQVNVKQNLKSVRFDLCPMVDTRKPATEEEKVDGA